MLRPSLIFNLYIYKCNLILTNLLSWTMWLGFISHTRSLSIRNSNSYSFNYQPELINECIMISKKRTWLKLFMLLVNYQINSQNQLSSFKPAYQNIWELCSRDCLYMILVSDQLLTAVVYAKKQGLPFLLVIHACLSKPPTWGTTSEVNDPIISPSRTEWNLVKFTFPKRRKIT